MSHRFSYPSALSWPWNPSLSSPCSQKFSCFYKTEFCPILKEKQKHLARNISKTKDKTLNKQSNLYSEKKSMRELRGAVFQAISSSCTCCKNLTSSCSRSLSHSLDRSPGFCCLRRKEKIRHTL